MEFPFLYLMYLISCDVSWYVILVVPVVVVNCCKHKPNWILPRGWHLPSLCVCVSAGLRLAHRVITHVPRLTVPDRWWTHQALPPSRVRSPSMLSSRYPSSTSSSCSLRQGNSVGPGQHVGRDQTAASQMRRRSKRKRWTLEVEEEVTSYCIALVLRTGAFFTMSYYTSDYVINQNGTVAVWFKPRQRPGWLNDKDIYTAIEAFLITIKKKEIGWLVKGSAIRKPRVCLNQGPHPTKDWFKMWLKVSQR